MARNSAFQNFCTFQNPKASSKPNAVKKWKKMDLKELSFYWDTESVIFDGMTQSELLVKMLLVHSMYFISEL